MLILEVPVDEGVEELLPVSLELAVRIWLVVPVGLNDVVILLVCDCVGVHVCESVGEPEVVCDTDIESDCEIDCVKDAV